MKIGLKVFSIDKKIIPEIEKAKEGKFDYIELYVVPCSFSKTISKWKTLDFPFIIHAPHSGHGVNFAIKELQESNEKKFKEAQKFADALNSGIIIVHGGNNGSFAETLRQLYLLKEKRIVLENKPKIGVCGEVCVGCSVEEFKKAFSSGIIKGMVLDLAHAYCAANSLGVKPIELIKKFLQFNPVIFHLSDTETNSQTDMHLNLGKGGLNIRQILSFIPENAFVTLETSRDEKKGLDDFYADTRFLKRLLPLKNKKNIKNIILRKADNSDSHDLWQWRNQPLVRQLSFNNKKISYKEHKILFAGKIKDKDASCYIAENNEGEKIGQVRFDKSGRSQWKININLNPEFFGQGMGNIIIKKASRFFLETKKRCQMISAEIFEDNEASIKAFKKAGYVLKSNTEKNNKKIKVFVYPVRENYSRA